MVRYVHCDVLAAPPAAASLDSGFDGIGIVWHRSPAARAAHLADTSSRERMERDEQETFARPIVQTCLVTGERVLLAPRSDVGSFKITRLLTARDRSQGAELARLRESEGAALRRQLREAGIEVHGHVVDVPLPPENGVRWGLDVDCIEELWFGSSEDAVLAAEHLAAHDPLRSAPRPAARIQILTNEVELYNDAR